MTRPRKKFYQATDGEWIRVHKNEFSDMCCDCHLVHKLKFRIVDGTQIEVQSTRDARATAAARRSFKFTPDED